MRKHRWLGRVLLILAGITLVTMNAGAKCFITSSDCEFLCFD